MMTLNYERYMKGGFANYIKSPRLNCSRVRNCFSPATGCCVTSGRFRKYISLGACLENKYKVETCYYQAEVHTQGDLMMKICCNNSSLKQEEFKQNKAQSVGYFMTQFSTDLF